MKTKNIFIIIGILIAIVLILVFISRTFFMTTSLATTLGICSGTVESIDSITLRTSSDLGGRKVIRVIYSTLPTSECLDITLSESQIEDLITAEDFEVTNGIRGNVQLLYQKKESTINKKTEKYLKFQQTEITGTLFCSKSACEREDVYGTFKAYTEGGKCYCITDEQVGNKATFTSSGNLVWGAIVTIGGQETFLMEGKLSDKIGDIAFIKWVGNVQSNYVLDGVFQEAYFHLADNKFRMVDLGSYGEVEAERRRVRGRLEDCILFCADEVKEMYAYNSFLTSKTKDRINAWANDEPGVDSAKIISNRLIIDVKENTLVYPKFILDIDALEVGVFISHGEPKAICPDDFSINSGSNFRAKATAENIGSASGSFTWWVECDKGSQVVYPGPPLTIGAKSSKTITITSGLTVEEAGTRTARCEFFVKEVNTLKEDSCLFKYDSTKVTRCTSGVKSCENGNQELWTCLPDGSYDKVECEFGCESFGNSFRCVLQSTEICDNGIDDNGDGLIDSEDPQCASEKVSWLYLIPIVLTLGLSGFFGIKGRIRRGKFKWFDFVVGGILGLGVGLILFFVIRWIVELNIWKWLG